MTSLKNGEYILTDRIDKGAFGEVFKGIDKRLPFRERTVAIKKCKLLKGNERRGTPDPKLEAVILRELSQASDAKHVIAVYYDSFVDDEYHYLVMEHCKYGSLYDYLLKERQKPFTEEQTRDILLDVLTALDIIHSAGYLHRDLSPKNILIHAFNDDSTPRIRLVDFGLSKKIIEIKGTVAGTPGFFDADMMRKGYSKNIDFYALGCVMFFMLTSQLISTRETKLSPSQIENKLRLQSLSKDAINLVMLLTSRHHIEKSMDIRMHTFFTSEAIKAAHIQASSIRQSIGYTDHEHRQESLRRDPFKELQNRPNDVRERENKYHYQHQQAKLRPVHTAYSLPTKMTAQHPSKLSVATSSSPPPWPLSSEFKEIVKNVMVNNFGRAILRGQERLFICETLCFKDGSNKCTFVGRLINACSVTQELRMYRLKSELRLFDFTVYPNGIPESELELINRIRSPYDLEKKEEGRMARTMYSRMRSILKAVCEMVRKREENPKLIVDTLAKVTWGGMISVDLPDKQVIRWPCRARGPPIKDYPRLSPAMIDMLYYVHQDFSQLFDQRRN